MTAVPLASVDWPLLHYLQVETWWATGRCVGCGEGTVGERMYCATCYPIRIAARGVDRAVTCIHGERCPFRCSRCGLHTRYRLDGGQCGACVYEVAHPGKTPFAPLGRPEHSPRFGAAPQRSRLTVQRPHVGTQGLGNLA